MKHELKIRPEYFAAVVSGYKTFEIRNNADRNFQVGDTLLLWEWGGGFTGQTVERAISYITDFEQKPGYVVLGLASKREQELAEQLADATRQGGVMAGLLREARKYVTALGKPDDEISIVQMLVSRIDSALAGKLPTKPVAVTETIRTAPERIWLQVGDQAHYHGEPFPSDTSEVSWCADSVAACEVPYVRADMAGHVVSPSLSLLIKMTDILKMCRSALITAYEDVQDDTGKGVIQYRIKLATKGISMAEHAIDAAKANSGRLITEGQELELVTVLQSIMNGLSDDPAHDAAALLKRITGEVPWTGDSFQLPPHQGGEPLNQNPVATAGQAESILNKQPSLTGQVLAGMGAATLLAGLDKESASDVVQLMLEAAEAKGGGSCATDPRSSSPD